MIALSASEIAKIVGGTLHGEDLMVTAPVVIDSRKAQPGSAFIAIVGEQVDGHDFVADAFKFGAVLALTSRGVTGNHIVVADVIIALSQLAAHVRLQLPNLTVIGITGSQGKTTTKELLAAVLSSAGKTISPQGNLNNEIGVPLVLLNCQSDTKFCIVEMGARHQGDIAHLCQIAKPQIGVVLRVGSAHLGEFGSMAAIAQTKSEMISSLSSEGIAILGDYDQYTPKMAKLHSGRTLTFGENQECDIRATDIEVREGCAHFDLVTPAGRSAVGLRIAGLHQVSNALAAAAVATVAGLSLDQIASGLSMAQSHAKWRMEIEEIGSLVLINDAYNASPEASAAALRTLALFAQERGGESWALLGKMHELGESSAKDHAAIGTLASELGIDHLVCIAADEYASALTEQDAISVHRYLSKSGAADIAMNFNPGDVVLVKASRSEKFEELAEAVKGLWQKKIDEAIKENGEAK